MFSYTLSTGPISIGSKLNFLMTKKKDAEIDPIHIVKVRFDLTPPEVGPTPREKSEKQSFWQLIFILKTRIYYILALYGMLHNS